MLICGANSNETQFKLRRFLHGARCYTKKKGMRKNENNNNNNNKIMERNDYFVYVVLIKCTKFSAIQRKQKHKSKSVCNKKHNDEKMKFEFENMHAITNKTQKMKQHLQQAAAACTFNAMILHHHQHSISLDVCTGSYHIGVLPAEARLSNVSKSSCSASARSKNSSR
jgi:DNA repair exonuclease SbcCD nuclease subunit